MSGYLVLTDQLPSNLVGDGVETDNVEGGEQGWSTRPMEERWSSTSNNGHLNRELLENHFYVHFLNLRFRELLREPL
jgi:hypothetical protein